MLDGRATFRCQWLLDRPVTKFTLKSQRELRPGDDNEKGDYELT